MYDVAFAPFATLGWTPLLGGLLLSLSAAPVGVFLMLRRMSLTGDALSHAILPGAAIAFLFYGMAVLPMTLGGLVVGLIVALGAGAVSRATVLREDISLAAFYLISLAAGVMIVSLNGSDEELIHLLFGDVEAMNPTALALIAAVGLITLTVLAVIWRALIAECLDPLFLRSVSRVGAPVHFSFLVLVVLNLVVGFHALGTLMAVGLMMLPAATARLWTNRIETLCLLSVVFGAAATVAGIIIAHHAATPLGPTVVLVAGAVYLASVLFASRGMPRAHPHRHRTA